MSVGNIQVSSPAVPLTPQKIQQPPPVAATKQSAVEEAQESPKERAAEANKGESIDTYA